MSSITYLGEKQNDYPHGQGVLIADDLIFEGTWEKGRRIKIGTYRFNAQTLVVKFRKGKIYKLLKIEQDKPISLIKLNQVNYRQQGEYYEEIPNTDNCFFYLIEQKIMFDGFPSNNSQYHTIQTGDYTIYGFRNDVSGLKEVRFKKFRLISRLLNKTPLGPIKVIIGENHYFKGYAIGHSFIGSHFIKQGDLKLIFQDQESESKKMLRLFSKVQNLDITIKKEGNHFKATQGNIELDEIYNNQFLISFLSDCFFLMSEIVDGFFKFSSKRPAIINSLMVSNSWLEIEMKELEKIQKIKAKETRKKFERNQVQQNLKTSCKFNPYESKTVKRIDYFNDGIYCGELKNDIRDGLGCFYFKNGDTYKGYFKNGLFSGKGCLETSEFRIKGIWERGQVLQLSFFLNKGNRSYLT